MITFLHWRHDPARVQELIPPWLEVETFDGSAWVGLTPFLLDNLRTPVTPRLPWLGRFPETNVRTYVRGPDGRSGIWFMALDTSRLAAALFGRSTYFLPYNWGQLQVDRHGSQVHYHGTRRWPNRHGSYDIRVEIGDPYEADDLNELDHFLTGRWLLFTHYTNVMASVSVQHESWPLWRGEADVIYNSSLAGVGLATPTAAPLVHFSTGVDTRISTPTLHGLHD